MHNFRTRMRNRRNAREFERALRSASPAVRQELIAAASRTMYERL
ncbi:MAG TPA: hypothetical protein VFH38_06345 [Jatrophihabitans sp.]|nr:hypothetical protein [Jatrophihabitans sp.]